VDCELCIAIHLSTLHPLLVLCCGLIDLFRVLLYIRAAALWQSRGLPSVRDLTLCSWVTTGGADKVLCKVSRSISVPTHPSVYSSCRQLGHVVCSLIIFVRSLWSLGSNTTTIESWEIERHEALLRRARVLGGYLDGPDGVKVRIERQEFRTILEYGRT
jgi:palmitoyltransferase